MEDVEAAWQNCETLRNAYVKKTYDGSRGGVKLTEGNLCCPVFKNYFHSLFFLDLPVEKVLDGIEVLPVPPVHVSSGTRGSDAGVEASTSTMQGDGEQLRKRPRQD
jgi:hypothetical protein